MENAELSLLGAMMVSAEAVRLAVELDPEDFTDKKHALLFSAMKELHEDGKPVDVITVTGLLNAKGILQSVGGLKFLNDSVLSMPSASNASAYIECIRSDRQRREFIQGMQASVKCAMTGQDYIACAQRVIDGVISLGTHDIQPVGDRAMQAFVGVGKASKLKTGFYGLDYTIDGGFKAGQLIIVGGQPGMGKTTFAMNVGVDVSSRGRKVLVFSLEMTVDELLQRAAVSMCEINAYEAQQDMMATDELLKAAERIAGYQLYIDDTGGVSVDYIKAKCYKVKPDLVIIDNLNIMGITVGRGETRERGIADVTCKLKALAKDLNCPIILVVQLNRMVATRKIKSPLLSDIRDSGSIEQDADIVLFPYRPAVNGESEDRSEAVIIVAKHRNGQTGDIDMLCDMQHFKFKDKTYSGFTEINDAQGRTPWDG